MRLRNHYALDYEQTTGYVQLLRTEREVAASEPVRALLTELEVRHALLDAAGCRRLEPALHPATALAGGLHLPDDETGNCAYFAHQLKDIAANEGVEFRFGVEVNGLDMALGRVEALQTATGPLRADAYVLAGGVDSARLLARAGIRLPLLAVKGYSATAAITAFEHAPFTSVMDETYKVALTRMGNRLRVAGTAELGTRGMGAARRRPAHAAESGERLVPLRRDLPAGEVLGWRASMLPDGPPVLGRTPVANLYLNTGHGSSGWVMAVGSGRVVADVLSGHTPEIDLDGLTLDRYGAGATA